MSSIDPIANPQYDKNHVVDQERIANAVREILLAIGEDPKRDGLTKTPERVAKAYAELVAGMRQDPVEVLSTTFDLGHEELVIVRDIRFNSLCEHHMLPFFGNAHIAYIPDESGRITGLSKLARLVDMYARRLQVQERFTTQIADALVEVMHASGVLVVVDAEHLCMSMRGANQPGSRTLTSAVRGQLRKAATRAEAMSLLGY
ncbi:MAG: GTP cyclohydrolase I FolE [Actinobacteria bacterium]|nr:GTP cyclohydrolase I FolE [Actinomycetota bacterium]